MSQNPDDAEDSKTKEGSPDSSLSPAIQADGTLEVVASDIAERLKGQIPGPEQTKVTKIVREVISERSEHFVGPQPPPALLAEYERICPGWAVRLLQMGADEQAHRHKCESKVLQQNDEQLKLENRDATYAMTGLILGFVAFVILGGIGVFAMRFGHENVALACFGTFAVGIIGAFIAGYNRKPKGKTKLGVDTD